MEKLRLNIDNARYYSEDFIKGWEIGVEAQFKADVREEQPKGEWGEHGECHFCGYIRQWEDDKFCGNCGADMRGK